MSQIVYLATPYSYKGNDKAIEKMVMNRRYERALDITAELLNRGLIVYCPIVHFHNIAKKHALPTDAEYWKKCNDQYLLACGTMIVAKMKGWTSSVGVAYEIEFARDHGIPVDYLTV